MIIDALKYGIFLVFMLRCKFNKQSLPYFDSYDFTPRWSSVDHAIPKFQLINQNGDTITNDDYNGKIYIADFFFTTCPGICPKLTKHMKILEDLYSNNDQIKFLSYTVMPWHDSVSVLNEYGKKYDIDSEKWNLLTGDKEEIYRVARDGYFADNSFKVQESVSNFIHTENFYLIDKKGKIRGVYNGTLEVEVERLKRHIITLEKENI